ncbi:leucyl aminopeptidase [Marinilabiliaceae bacterium JC017]|nr:leucyl aminopeptidase [Marinilabiliaceae bacterium JC017]
MNTQIKLITDKPDNVSTVFLLKELEMLQDFGFSKEEIAYVTSKAETKEKLIGIPELGKLKYVRLLDSEQDSLIVRNEALRRNGYDIFQILKKERYNDVCVFDLTGDKDACLAMCEGLLLSSYAFNKYITQDKEKVFDLNRIMLSSPVVTPDDVEEINLVCEAVSIARNLVNEPVGALNAVQLGDVTKVLGEKYGFSVDVFNKSKIESLKFGGLLAVNKGSQDPPTFITMEWKPENVKTEKPVVLVGKGVVFDTGGMNLKTMPGSLDEMKCDMGGAASVIGAMVALAANKIPVHVIGLVPATDNRPGFNAYVPGDIIKMHNELTVEVINTDAEGRLILADALSYARRFEPDLVIDLATLTGSAVMALGHYGMVGMGTANEDEFGVLQESGEIVYERVVKFPFWNEYGELIKSDIADLKNLGGREAGAITAGKFLAHFTNYPWIHLDIAGPAYVAKDNNYRGKGASGVGVRLLYHFLRNRVKG